ncbi:MAG: bifunctional adenosylcobinamide kinase/adenosylcobinamide-phosphate guanylyltransferase [Armatimonadota bacterium]|nr:bifunctional adenosylcobinamide kinase/adenosylcobinamide-phosphate guanylyltransferase [Armatimonadota bacterium]MCX7777105.1 bifunctional adenosylcobinamide kinase/adenosylcobinamide-phosphate guanylyltransferase [Armatimonadota bacterium]MDW8025152.1 bifunctional adenosylcobinamide kinase/adenosylcobinamide-phosphate guanylyltransferase [Armatimonadota bacterium]
MSILGLITLLLGGARSGKSRFAVELAKGNARVAFIATAARTDDEMERRIEMHRRSRPKEWLTIEEPICVSEWIDEHGDEFEVVVIDCITLWLTNLIAAEADDDAILCAVERLLKACKERRCNTIIVSNEVGMGIVPATPIGRRFRDLLGEANQKLASGADCVYWLCAGIPICLKGCG